MNVIERPWLEQIEPYRPGRHAAGGDGSMASNESPVGASPAVAAALHVAARSLHRYPDPLADELRDELAALHDVHPDQILVGNGSDELIYLLASAFLAQTGTAVCADPPYRIDEISTYVVGARLVRVPLRGWTHDLDAMGEVVADVAHVVNPHNPTGTTSSRDDIERLIEVGASALVVVDEAYIDFVDNPAATTAMPLARDGRAVVLRTFSKIHGLAGLRVGYLVGPVDVVAALRRIRPPFSVGALAQAGALAALRDRGHRDRVRNQTRKARSELTTIVRAAGYEPVPSQANFVLVRAGADGEEHLLDRLERNGISARPGRALGLPGTVRISVPGRAGLRLLATALPPVSGPGHLRIRTDKEE